VLNYLIMLLCNPACHRPARSACQGNTWYCPYKLQQRGDKPKTPRQDRRHFVKLCASSAAAVAASPEGLAGLISEGMLYQRVQLLDEHGNTLAASSLATNENYLFFYPFVATPCFLIRLDRPVIGSATLRTENGRPYHWPGGTGPDRSIVSFSAICAHKMSHPSSQVSFINYRPEEVQFAGSDQRLQRRAGVIYCCSEGSVCDPAQGARVLGGPAPQPLAAILLEYEPTSDALFAVGVAGQPLFGRYFEQFWHRLQLEFKTEAIRQPVEGGSRVTPLSSYCNKQVLC